MDIVTLQALLVLKLPCQKREEVGIVVVCVILDFFFSFLVKDIWNVDLYTFIWGKNPRKPQKTKTKSKPPNLRIQKENPVYKSMCKIIVVSKAGDFTRFIAMQWLLYIFVSQ